MIVYLPHALETVNITVLRVCLSGKQPLANVDSLLHDATAMLATIYQPTLDALPKYQVFSLFESCDNHMLFK